MTFGNKLYQSRKNSLLSEEVVAEKLKVSKAMISKWENGEEIPDAYQVKELARLYNVVLDELIDDNSIVEKIEKIIKNTDERIESKVDWTKTWSNKYPVLATYKNIVDVEKYASEIRNMFNSLSALYGYNKLDSMLVLKDILYHEWKDSNSK